MTLRFQIDYATKWGESLCLRYRGRDGEQMTLPLHAEDGHTWRGELGVSAFDKLTYSYEVVGQDNSVVRALRPNLFCVSVDGTCDILRVDHWPIADIPAEFLHSAFTDCIFAYSEAGIAHHNARTNTTTSTNNGASGIPLHASTKDAIENHNAETVVLHLYSVPPPKGFRWAVVGSSPSLGQWDVNRAKFLECTAVYEWEVAIAREDFLNGVEYKYLLCPDTGLADVTQVRWEEGENRYLPNVALKENERAEVGDGCPLISRTPWRGAGVVIPVFSLRTRGSQGIGDLGDLTALVRWAASVGLKAVQLLPINDTTSSGTWHDSYPYNCISVFALHPIYLDLRQWRDLPIYAAYKSDMERLNALTLLDYEAVFALKLHFLDDLFRLKGKVVLSKSDYAAFVHENEAWLMPYARFMATKRLLDAERTATFFCFVQFLLHRQMQATHDVARSLGIILKGDIPIGVSPNSVPATTQPQLFHLDGQAGAPPDAFARNGQNWGFPTYNWDAMAADGYRWWRERLHHMGRYFDAYRIDHVLGFFRIWEIPTTEIYGLLGHFRPALPFSVDEIRRYGFTADVERYARPFITAARREELEQEFPRAAWNTYLHRADGEKSASKATRYVLAAGYETQRGVLSRIEDKAVANALCDIVAERLFIVDPDSPNLYHPRIAAMETAVFQTLPPADREAFNRLHDDFFYRRHNDFWASEAMKKLPAIVAGEHTMLPCAEDLGMVPTSVEGVLEQLHILSLEIQRMPKAYGVRFSRLSDNPYLSVATPETHDMPPIRLWWHEDREQTRAFWHEAIGHESEPSEEATPMVVRQIVSEHLASPSMLCLISLQDLLAMDEQLSNPDYAVEQINVPANAHHYWKYRLHLNVEDLLSATAFNELLRSLVTANGR